MLSEKLMAEAQMTWEEKLRSAEGLAATRSELLEVMENQMATLTEQLAESERARVAAEEERLRLLEQLEQASKAAAAPVASGGSSDAGLGGVAAPGENSLIMASDPTDDENDDDDDDDDLMPLEFVDAARAPRAYKGGSSDILAAAADATASMDVPPGGPTPRLSLLAPPKPSDVWYSLLDDEDDEYYWNPATGVTTWEVGARTESIGPPPPPRSLRSCARHCSPLPATARHSLLLLLLATPRHASPLLATPRHASPLLLLTASG